MRFLQITSAIVLSISMFGVAHACGGGSRGGGGYRGGPSGAGPVGPIAPTAPPVKEIVSGGVVELPGDWGPQGYACLMLRDKYTYFKVLEWTPKGVKLAVPQLDVTAPFEADLLMVGPNRRAFPSMPVRVLLPVAGTPVSTASVPGQEAATRAPAKESVAPVQAVAPVKTNEAKVAPVSEASDAPPDLVPAGTFE
jgi:hypothetical protein